MVSVKVKGEPYFFGDAVRGEIKGQYDHGTAMAGAPVKPSVASSAASKPAWAARPAWMGLLSAPVSRNCQRPEA